MKMKKNENENEDNENENKEVMQRIFKMMEKLTEHIVMMEARNE